MKKKTRRLLLDAFLSSILSSILIIIVTTVFLNLDFLNPLHKALEDFNFLDVYYSENFDGDESINKDIILVNVSNRNRAEIAEMLNYVLKENPTVIGMDVIYKDLDDEFSDSILKNSFNSDKIVFSLDIKDGQVYENHPYFDTSEEMGFINYNFDPNVTVIREFVGIKNIHGREISSFASKISKKYLGESWDERNYHDKLKKIQTIKYSGNLDQFLVLDYDDFNFFGRKKILRDKIIIFGYLGLTDENIDDIQDKFFTPLNPYPTGKSDADMFGTVVHANIVNMLINNDFLYKVPKAGIYFITFIVIFLTSIFYIKNNRMYKISGRTRKVVFQSFLAVAIILLTLWLFELGVILWPFPILVGMFLAGSYFKYYKHFVRYIKTKRKWKTFVK